MANAGGLKLVKMNVQKVILVLPIFSMLLVMANAGGLKLDYYKHSCPDAEKIVQEITERYIKHVPSFAAGLLRMNFHDCFVRGCDGSVLLKPTKENNQTESTAIPNSTLRGFEIIDAIKEALENKCPGVVSCADILSLATRDAIRTINGPWWEVPMGRMDGRVSSASEANADIPSPFSDINTLKQNFAAKGLNTKDLVVLSGRGDTDPALSPGYAAWLKTRCQPNPNDSTTFVFMDRITPKVFDEKYYTMVTQNRGLFQSDAALLNDTSTSYYVRYHAMSMGSTFAKDFATSMVKLIQIEDLSTRGQGEIRKNCGYVN